YHDRAAGGEGRAELQGGGGLRVVPRHYQRGDAERTAQVQGVPRAVDVRALLLGVQLAREARVVTQVLDGPDAVHEPRHGDGLPDLVDDERRYIGCALLEVVGEAVHPLAALGGGQAGPRPAVERLARRAHGPVDVGGGAVGGVTDHG